MKFCTEAMFEYSLRRQRQDYQDALRTPLVDARSEPQSIYDTQQQSSWLCRLPIEIRLQVWQYVVGNQRIHIINKYRRLGHAVMNDEYWHQHHAERPSLRTCSWMYTYGSLPSSKQLASNTLCDLLATCRQIYQEAVILLYSTNIFTFWDLRTVAVFARCIPLVSWERIRSVEVYAMFYRKDDINDAIEARSLLQLEAWPNACSTLATLPHLRSLKIQLANPKYLDKRQLMGQRVDVHDAVLAFVREIKAEVKFDVYVGVKSSGNGAWERWILKDIDEKILKRLGEQLQSNKSKASCRLLC